MRTPGGDRRWSGAEIREERADLGGKEQGDKGFWNCETKIWCVAREVYLSGSVPSLSLLLSDLGSDLRGLSVSRAGLGHRRRRSPPRSLR